MEWKPIEQEKIDWLYSDESKDIERGCIGHLRGDFGHGGDEFWTSWFDHREELKTQEFRDEFDSVVNGAIDSGLLANYRSMCKACRAGTPIIDNMYGFRMETENYEYCLRCTTIRGVYSFYIYCYRRKSA